MHASAFDSFRDRLRERLLEPLPGPDLHARMAPSHRDIVDPELARQGEHREGSVLVLLYPATSGVETVYTVRKANLTNHGGQISFPGGRIEEGESAEEAAIREANEEIDLNPESIEVVGRMTALYIPPSRFIVNPFLAVSGQPPALRPQETEVDRILEVPLTDLMNPENHREEVWDIRGEKSHVPWYAVAGVRIWGATAMITRELLELVDPQTYSG